MKVKCIINNLNNIKDDSARLRADSFFNLPDGILNISIDSIYTVLCIEFRENSQWYYLCIDGDDYPTAYPSELFVIEDSKLSRHWKLSSYHNTLDMSDTRLTFEEWANDPLFYERLLDDDPKAQNSLAHYQKLLLLE